MKMTREQANKIHVPIHEIEFDLDETVTEISDFKTILSVLVKNPSENRIKIYMTEGNIAQRQDFVRKLKCILDLRNDPTLMEIEHT